MARICVKCGTETKEIPCPNCGGGEFKNEVNPTRKRLTEIELMAMMGLKSKGENNGKT